MCRSRRSCLSLAVLLALLSPGAASAANDVDRFELSLGVQEEYTSNVLRDEDDERHDWITRLTPGIQYREDGDWGRVQLSTRLVSRSYARESGLNSVSRFFDGQWSRDFKNNLSLLLRGAYSLEPNRDAVEEADRTLTSARPDQERAHLGFALGYQFDPLSSMSFTGDFDDVDYGEGDQPGTVTQAYRDRQFYSTALAYNQQLSKLDVASLILSYGHADYADAGEGEEKTDSYAASLRWNRAWSPFWTTTAEIGGRYLENEVVSGTDHSIGMTGGLQVQRETDFTTLRVGYFRTTTPSYGVGGSLDQDSLEGRFDWKLNRDWRLDVRAAWERSLSATTGLFSVRGVTVPGFPGLIGCPVGFTPGPGDRCVAESGNEVDSEYKTVSVALNWRFARDFNTFVRYTFRTQDSTGDRRLAQYDDHRVMIGVRYSYGLDVF